MRDFEKNLNETLVTNILKKIPSNIKPVSYLMELLELSRESIYRRLRGEIPFSIAEIAKLSLALDFSIDQIVGSKKKERMFFDLPSAPSTEPVMAFQLMLQKYKEHLDDLINGDCGESTMALNHFPPTLLVFFDSLFKFTYYKWLQKYNSISLKDNFSDIKIPEKVTLLQKEIRENLYKIEFATLIFDPNVFLSLIQDVSYFHKRKLINEEELKILKKEIYDFIDMSEMMAKTGLLGTKTRISLYLSSLYINANTGCVSCIHKNESLFWIFTVNPIIIRNTDLYLLQKSWLDSLKRQSTLITQSNEILQSEFFDKQRQYLAAEFQTD